MPLSFSSGRSKASRRLAIAGGTRMGASLGMRALHPDLLPIIRTITEHHPVLAFVTIFPHAAHKSARPRPLLDTMNRATTLPPWLTRKLRLVYGPMIDSWCTSWTRSHSSSRLCSNELTRIGPSRTTAICNTRTQELRGIRGGAARQMDHRRLRLRS
jgi:hypothetical protein